jgi:hypothetical protein
MEIICLGESHPKMVALLSALPRVRMLGAFAEPDLTDIITALKTTLVAIALVASARALTAKLSDPGSSALAAPASSTCTCKLFACKIYEVCGIPLFRWIRA